MIVLIPIGYHPRASISRNLKKVLRVYWCSICHYGNQWYYGFAFGLQAAIVCTGSTYDYRFPGYFDTLLQKIRQWNVQNNIHILGYIAKADQLQLMRKAMAVIQPTLFEGGPGGGSVREAVALGIPVIASDIPVNREIGEDKAIFFKAGSAADLAEKMEIVAKTSQLGRPRESTLLERGRTYAEAKGTRLLEAISYVREAYR